MHRKLVFATAVFYGMLGVLSSVLYAGSVSTREEGESRLVVRVNKGEVQISRHIYGHFSEHLGHCIYGGFWVGENSPIPNTRGIRNDVVAALKKIQIPNLRWPGGCFADEYHWQDGIGPRSDRPAMLNTHWGGVVEDNHFGTHEFMDLCAQLECEPYICGNVGSGTVQEMQSWVEYLTFDKGTPMADLRRVNGREEPWKIKYWGVGNENWGCGGRMTAEFYSDQFRRFSTYLRDLSGNVLQKVACGANFDDYNWTETLMKNVDRGMWGLSLHYYTRVRMPDKTGQVGKATGFAEDEWFRILEQALVMEELLEQHSAIMDRYDPKKQVALVVDEWGTWYKVEPNTHPRFLYQQNSLRDALVAGLTLNAFNRYSDRVKMANIAQTVNVLQAMILTKDEQMVLTPSYHVYDMYKVHQDATMLPIELKGRDYTYNGKSIAAISASASKDKKGRVHLSLCNLDPNSPAVLSCELAGLPMASVKGSILTADSMDAHNSFESPNSLSPGVFDAFKKIEGGLQVTLPAKSVVVLEIGS